MSPALLVYLGVGAVIVAYSAYIDTDDPLVFVFLALAWPIVAAFLVPVTIGYTVRWLVKKVAP